MKEAFNIALNETRVIDIKFLHQCAKPTVCMLYQDTSNLRHVKTFVVDAKDKDFSVGPWSHNNVEFGASLIIPVPAPIGGILLVGACSITYLGPAMNGASNSSSSSSSSSNHHSYPATVGGVQIQTVDISPCLVCCHACIAEDGSRFLLGDHRGVLSVVVLALDPSNHHQVLGLSIDTAGVTSIAESLSYLGDGLVFVGSIYGDSQLVKLRPEKDAEGSNVAVLQTFQNIGPVRDMCLVDNDKHGGQRQLVTCSGAYKDGSLRIIRSGIGMHEQASLEVGGIKGLWSMRTGDYSLFDKYLVQAFVGETRVLAIESEEMGEVHYRCAVCFLLV
jgi:DNA damage-binding protein 1